MNWRREPGAGRYAHPERERRFRLDALPPGLDDGLQIVDRYITGTRLRLRQVSDGEVTVYKLGQKVRTEPSDPSSVMMTNIYLSDEEYAVFHGLPARELRKTRYRVGAFAIDRFHDALEGLVLAETEDEHAVPPFEAEDVSRDDRYSGGQLAR